MTSTPKNLVFIGDFHIGNKNYNKKLLIKDLKTIEERDYDLVLMGDYCEFINQASFKYESQTMPPKKQFNIFKKLFEPFAIRNKIKGCLKGNHEDRYFTKLDGLEDWCELYNIRYNKRHLTFRYGNKYFYAHHPKLTATTTAGRDRIFQKMRNVRDADVYISGHFHSLFDDKAHRYTKKGVLRTILFACSGSYLAYPNSYAEDKLYAPANLGCKLVSIKKNKIYMEDMI